MLICKAARCKVGLGHGKMKSACSVKRLPDSRGDIETVRTKQNTIPWQYVDCSLWFRVLPPKDISVLMAANPYIQNINFRQGQFM